MSVMKFLKTFCLLLFGYTAAVAQHKERFTNLLQAGDTLVMTVDTNCPVAFMPDTANISLVLEGDMYFAFDGRTYKIKVLPHYLMKADGTLMGPAILVSGNSLKDDYNFTATISASVKHANGAAIKLNPCSLATATIATSLDSCVYERTADSCVLRLNELSHITCQYSTAEDKKSLAYAIEQYLLRRYRAAR